MDLPVIPRISYVATESCNFHCVSCGAGSNHVPAGLGGKFDEALSAMKSIRKVARIHNFSVAGGEPFLVPDLEEQINQMLDCIGPNEFWIFTNGSILLRQPLRILKIKRLPIPCKLRVSIHPELLFDFSLAEIRERCEYIANIAPNFQITTTAETRHTDYNVSATSPSATAPKCKAREEHNCTSVVGNVASRCALYTPAVIKHHPLMSPGAKVAANASLLTITQTTTTKELQTWLQKIPDLCYYCTGSTFSVPHVVHDGVTDRGVMHAETFVPASHGKIDMRNVSTVIPFRNDKTGSRLQALAAVLRHLMEWCENLDVIIVEQDSTSQLPAHLLVPGVRAALIRNPDMFNPSIARNTGAKWSTRVNVWFLDGDVINSPEAMASIASYDGNDILRPYTSLRETKRPLVNELSVYKAIQRHMADGRRDVDGGSLALQSVFPQKAFAAVGYFDERFCGRGYEDGEFMHRIHKLGYPVVYLKAECYHVDHDLPHGATARNGSRENLVGSAEAVEVQLRNHAIYKASIAAPADALRITHGLSTVATPREVRHIYQEPQFGQDWFSYRHFYASLVKGLPSGSTIVEVGSWKGKSTAFLAVEVLNSGKSIAVHAVDTWLGSDEEAHHIDPDVKAGTLYERFLSNIEPLRAVITPVRMSSLDASKGYADNSLAVVYIDASHKYQDVKNDIIAWLPKVRPGGILAGHDISMPDVQRAVVETLTSGIGYSAQENIWVYTKPG